MGHGLEGYPAHLVHKHGYEPNQASKIASAKDLHDVLHHQASNARDRDHQHYGDDPGNWTDASPEERTTPANVPDSADTTDTERTATVLSHVPEPSDVSLRNHCYEVGTSAGWLYFETADDFGAIYDAANERDRDKEPTLDRVLVTITTKAGFRLSITFYDIEHWAERAHLPEHDEIKRPYERIVL